MSPATTALLSSSSTIERINSCALAGFTPLTPFTRPVTPEGWLAELGGGNAYLANTPRPEGIPWASTGKQRPTPPAE